MVTDILIYLIIVLSSIIALWPLYSSFIKILLDHIFFRKDIKKITEIKNKISLALLQKKLNNHGINLKELKNYKLNEELFINENKQVKNRNNNSDLFKIRNYVNKYYNEKVFPEKNKKDIVKIANLKKHFLID